MTSKADRKRRKRAARRMPRPEVKIGPEIEKPLCDPMPATSSPSATPPNRRGGLMTDLQEAALRWFASLRRAQDTGGFVLAASRPQLEAIRLELSADEFSILSELCRSSGWINHRVGRSRQTVRELEMSALRKLVIYRATNGIQD